jgi:uncharacterized membrane protein YfcA
MHELLLPLLSFGIGIVVGLTGIGGASLLTPMLVLLFQVPPSVAVSSDIVAATLMKVVGGIKHWRQQTVNRQAVRWLVTGSVPGALCGVAVLHQLQQTTLDLDGILLRCIGSAILLVTLLALVRLMLLTVAPNFQPPQLPELDLDKLAGKAAAVAIGTVLGCIVGLTSVSSGSLFALVLISFFRLDAQRLVGTDLVQAAILLSFTSLGHLSLGTVDWHLVLPIWLGSVPGVLIGARLCQVAPQRLLRFIVYVLLVGVSWKLAYSS